jgi:hypothetical protein
MLAVSVTAHLISWRLSQARFRDALDLSTSSTPNAFGAPSSFA